MNVPEVIEKKREGGECTPEEIAGLVRGLVDGSIPEYQVSAWLMAVLFRGMTSRETASLTRIMMESGDVLDLSALPGVKVDKHSTGGVGDKVSIPLAPLVAAAGVTVPMISGRGLGHTGGTLDKLESIPGLTTALDSAGFRRVIEAVGFSIIGANAHLAPADGRLYALRDVTGTVPSIPLITASILSKKYAAGVDALVLDVKSGSGAFMRDHDDAVELARVLVEVSSQMGKKASAFVTSMDRPLGRAVGNALEIVESVECLRGEGPDDLREIVLVLGEEMLRLAGVERDRAAARRKLEGLLASGKAYETFARWVELQGGDASALERADGLPRAPVRETFVAARGGFLGEFDVREIGLVANALGAGRRKMGDAVDPAVGIVFRARPGDAVEPGQPLADVHARTQAAAGTAVERLARVLGIGEALPPIRPLVLEAGLPAA